MIYFALMNPREIKIGYSADPSRRLKEIRALDEQRPDLLQLLPGGRESERRCHRRFSYLRWPHSGERFFPGTELLDWIGLPLLRPGYAAEDLTRFLQAKADQVQHDLATARLNFGDDCECGTVLLVRAIRDRRKLGDLERAIERLGGAE